MSSRKRATARRRKSGTRRTKKEFPWVDLSDEELLEWRMCDLGVELEGTPLQRRVERLYEELEYREIRFRPHCWLSDEWFSHDDVPGIGIPFYLAHPRLSRLERRQMFDVEGGNQEWCLKILRHEAGHAIDTAYRLHRRRKWREVFGRFSQPYPAYYQPRPYSKRHVLHLDLWYAQSHPAEDFAETFAVWLKPKSRWRSQYQGWPALRKLCYVDEVMSEIAEQKPANHSRRRIAPLHRIRKTLAEHYKQRRVRFGLDHPDVYDRELRRLFSDAPEHSGRPRAASFLRQIRREVRQVVARWTGQYRYTIDQVLEEMIARCEELDLRLDRAERKAKRDALVMLTVQTMNYLHNGHHRIAL